MGIIGNLDKIFAGGSDDRTKTGKWFGSLQASKTPEEALGKIDNLINVGWKGETKTDFMYVVKPLVESGIVDAAYPTWWGKDSQYNLATMDWGGGQTDEMRAKLKKAREAYSQSDFTHSDKLNLQTAQMLYGQRAMDFDQDVKNKLMYGWDSKSDEQWKSIVGEPVRRPNGDYQSPLLSSVQVGGKYNRQSEDYNEYKPSPEWRKVPGFMDFYNNGGAGGNETLAQAFEDAGLQKQADAVRYYMSKTNGGGVEGQKAYLSTVYDTIKGSGYTGDLSKLETFLGV